MTTHPLDKILPKHDLEGFIAYMEKTDRVPDIRDAIKRVRLAFKDDPELVYQWGVQMMERSKEARDVSCDLLASSYALHRDQVQSFLVRLADDENWGVRESAAGAFALVLSEHFDEVYPLYQEWTRHPSENVRRAIVLSVMPVVRIKNKGAAYAGPCLRLLEPLLADRSEYVRKNLGPFAIGSAILVHYPDLTFDTLNKWAESDDEQVRWNVAMAVSSSGGARHPERSLALLYQLADDPRRFVWRAVASAAKNLGRKHPKLVVRELKRWAKDPARKQAAEIALSYIEH